MRKGEEDQGAKLVKVMTNILLGSAAALVICLVFLFICSIGISSGRFEEGLMYQLTIAGCAIGALAGGWLAVVRCRVRTLLVGLGTGAVLFLFLLTVGLLLNGSIDLEERGLGLLFGSLLGGALAGLLGGMSKTKKRKK